MLKNKVLIIIVLGFLIPQVTFAVWWNPISWFKKKVNTEQQTAVPVNSPIISTSTKVVEGTKPNIIVLEKKKEITKTLVKSDLPEKVKTAPPSSYKNVEIKKTCMNGLIVSVNENCTKVCPDGEVITENLTCRTVAIQPVDVCKNIEEIQTVIPTDMVLNSLGNCFTSITVQQEPVLNKIVVGVQGSFMEGATTTIIVYLYPAGMKSRDILNVKFHDNTGDTIVPATEVGYDTEKQIYFAKLIFKYLWSPSKGKALQVTVDGVGSKTVDTTTGEVR